MISVVETMTKVELALILQIIDTHTIKRSYNYGAPDTTHIDDVNKLKKDIMLKYEEVLKEN